RNILASGLQGHCAPSGASSRHVADHPTPSDGPRCRARERLARTADDHPHDEHGPPSAALRSPASDLVQPTGDVTIATDLGVPRSTARGWLGDGQTVVVSLDVANLKALELQQEVLELRRRVKKLTALLRLALALLRTSGFTLTHERLPDGRAKLRILRAIDRARAFVPLPAILRFLRP